jgi:AraC family transcriptional regulator
MQLAGGNPEARLITSSTSEPMNPAITTPTGTTRSATGPHTAAPMVFHGDFGTLRIASCARSWAAHIHREHQINFHVGGGPALIHAAERRYVLADREMNLHNPWALHSVKVDSKAPSCLITLNVAPAWLRRHISTEGGRLPAFTSMHEPICSHTLVLLENLMEMLLDGNESRHEGVPAIHQLIASVFHSHAGASAPAAVDAPGRDSDPRIRRSLDFIEGHAIGKIKVDDLASCAGMSRSHFFKAFKTSVGTSPLHVIEAVRISWAVERLTTSRVSIAEVGDELGFSTPGHFGRFFAMHMGLSPSEYRGRVHHLSGSELHIQAGQASNRLSPVS